MSYINILLNSSVESPKETILFISISVFLISVATPEFQIEGNEPGGLHISTKIINGEGVINGEVGKNLQS